MRLMIYMGATVYYRLDPICGYLVSFSPAPSPFSLSRFLFGSSRVAALLSLLASENSVTRGAVLYVPSYT